MMASSNQAKQGGGYFRMARVDDFIHSEGTNPAIIREY